MNYNELKEQDFDLISKVYKEYDTKDEAQEFLSDKYNVSKRTIRNWANKMGVGVMKHNIIDPLKIMVYDIETSKAEANVWWTGKQYVGWKQFRTDPKIISVSWKWLGEDEVYDLAWDCKKQCDKQLCETFISEYNKADMVIGFNNDNFDNRFIQDRFIVHYLQFNPYIRSYDIMKEMKRKGRLISYSLAYMCKHYGVEQKLEHEGDIMWEKIQYGTPEEQKEHLAKMIEYNRGDIISTEALYFRLMPYTGHQVHFGSSLGEEKWTCPDTGSKNVELWKTTWTKAGTIQRLFKSNETERIYKISNREYVRFLESKMKLS